MRHIRRTRCGPDGMLEVRTSEAPNGVLVVALVGELDRSVERDLRLELGRLQDEAPPGVILDLRGLGFADLAAARTVVAMARSAQAGAFRFAVRAGNGAAARVLDLAGLRKTGEEPRALLNQPLARRRHVAGARP